METFCAFAGAPEPILAGAGAWTVLLIDPVPEDWTVGGAPLPMFAAGTIAMAQWNHRTPPVSARAPRIPLGDRLWLEPTTALQHAGTLRVPPENPLRILWGSRDRLWSRAYHTVKYRSIRDPPGGGGLRRKHGVQAPRARCTERLGGCAEYLAALLGADPLKGGGYPGGYGSTVPGRGVVTLREDDGPGTHAE